MVKLTQVCEMMQKYRRSGINRVLMKLINTSAYIPSSAFLVQHSWWPYRSQIWGLIVPASTTVSYDMGMGHTHLRVCFQRPDMSLILDTNLPDLRFDCILLDAMNLQIKMQGFYEGNQACRPHAGHFLLKERKVRFRKWILRYRS